MKIIHKDTQAALSQDVVLKMVANLMEFPFSQICVHLVALNLLSALEKSGYQLNPALAEAVCSSRNWEVLEILSNEGVTPGNLYE